MTLQTAAVEDEKLHRKLQAKPEVGQIVSEVLLKRSNRNFTVSSTFLLDTLDMGSWQSLQLKNVVPVK